MRLGTATLVMVAFGVLTSGCSGGAGAQPTTLPSLTPSAGSTSPVPVPVGARASTPHGAAAFVRFYFDQLNRAFKRSDSSIVRAYSRPQCGTCENYIKALDFGRRSGYRIEGDSFHVSDVEAAPLQGQRTVVEAFGTVPPKREVDSAGRIVQTTSSTKRFHFSVVVQHASAGWLVSGIQIARA